MPFHATRCGAVALAGCLVLSGGASFAQQAAPAGAPAQQPAPQGPVKVALQASQADWTKVCGSAGPNKEICFTTRDFTPAADQPPLIAMAVYDVKGEEPIIRFLMPPGLLIRPGIRFSTDKGAQLEGSFTICLPNGCFAETRMKPAALEQMKKGTTLNVVARNSINNEVTFTLPLAGFGKAFNGPAVDPKVLQAQQAAQQKALQAQQAAQQQELQNQLEERAKQQRQTLEQQNAPGAAAPAAAPAPKK